MMKKSLIFFGIIALMLGAFGAGAITFHSAKASGVTSNTQSNSLFDLKTYPTYVVHGIPGVPVDVYVNNKLTIPNFQPGSTAGPFNLPTGFYTIALYPAGANPATTTPIVNTPVGISATLAPTSIVARLDSNGKPTLQPISESLDFTDFPGEGMLSIRNASTVAYPVAFACVAPVGTPNNFVTQNFNEYVKAGKYKVRIVPFGATDCSNPLATTTVTVQSEVDLNVYLVGSQSANTLQIIAQPLPDQGNDR